MILMLTVKEQLESGTHIEVDFRLSVIKPPNG